MYNTKQQCGNSALRAARSRQSRANMLMLKADRQRHGSRHTHSIQLHTASGQMKNQSDILLGIQEMKNKLLYCMCSPRGFSKYCVNLVNNAEYLSVN